MLRLPRNILMPVIVLFCIVGSSILGVVLGTMIDKNFVTSVIKSDDDPTVFFTRPIATWLAVGTFVVLFWSVGT